MADEEAKEEKPAEGGGGESPGEEAAAPKPSKGPLIVALVNTLAILGALGMAVYTKMIYKKPVITEDTERERLEAVQASAPVEMEPGQIPFKSMTLNIKPTPARPGFLEHFHYATLSFTMQIRDITEQDRFESVRVLFMDQLIEHLAKKTLKQLTHVQGRFILRAELVDLANDLIKDPVVTDVFFTEFIVE